MHIQLTEAAAHLGFKITDFARRQQGLCQFKQDRHIWDIIIQNKAQWLLDFLLHINFLLFKMSFLYKSAFLVYLEAFLSLYSHCFLHLMICLKLNYCAVSVQISMIYFLHSHSSFTLLNIHTKTQDKWSDFISAARPFVRLLYSNYYSHFKLITPSGEWMLKLFFSIHCWFFFRGSLSVTSVFLSFSLFSIGWDQSAICQSH